MKSRSWFGTDRWLLRWAITKAFALPPMYQGSEYTSTLDVYGPYELMCLLVVSMVLVIAYCSRLIIIDSNERERVIRHTTEV